MIGELLEPRHNQNLTFSGSPNVSTYSAEKVVLAVVRLQRLAGTRSATVYFETLDGGSNVVGSKLFAVRTGPEWEGQLVYIADTYLLSNFSGSSPFANLCEQRQIEGGSLNDTYPIDSGQSSVFYHMRGISARCRIGTFAPCYTQGVSPIRSPKVAIFRNPSTHTKRYYVRHRNAYFPGDPANPLLLAPTGDNTVTAAEAVGVFTEGTVYTGDPHPEIQLTGDRRLPTRMHSETLIEPFYYLSDLRGGKSIRVTYREIEEGTGDPIHDSNYPSDGTPRSDQQLFTSPLGGLNFNAQVMFLPIGGVTISTNVIERLSRL